MAKQKKIVPYTDLNIVTTYYVNSTKKETIRVNRSKYPRTAVMRCVDHMSVNSYGAGVAVIYDENNGMLHAVIVRHKNNSITIEYQRDQTTLQYMQMYPLKKSI